MSHFVSPDTGSHFELFGPSAPFDAIASRLDVPVLARVPLEPTVSKGGDAGSPVVLRGEKEGGESRKVFEDMARMVWQRIERKV